MVGRSSVVGNIHEESLPTFVPEAEYFWLRTFMVSLTPHRHILKSCLIQGAAERTPLFEKRINSKSKKIRQIFFYFWKAHRIPFYINVF